MNKFLIFLSFTLTSFAQQTFYVKNIKSGDPISYTFIYNENRTFKINAELDGSFQIPEIYLNDVFTFESVGYELMQTELDSEIIYLEDNSDLLEELIITKRLSSKEIRVGNKATKKHSSFVFNEENVFFLMTFGIKCSANGNLYPFVKEIHLKTRSKISTAKFEIQIYGIGADGKPRDLLHQQPIYGIAGKGISTTIVDVQSLNIQIMSDDFFVFFKPLYIEQNSYKIKSSKLENKYYYPDLLMNSSLENLMWIGLKTKNEQSWYSHALNDGTGYLNYIIEVVLTN